MSQYRWCTSGWVYVPCTYTPMPGESYRRQLGPLLLCLCVFGVLINSLGCWFCTKDLGLVLFQTMIKCVFCVCFGTGFRILLRQWHCDCHIGTSKVSMRSVFIYVHGISLYPYFVWRERMWTKRHKSLPLLGSNLLVLSLISLGKEFANWVGVWFGGLEFAYAWLEFAWATVLDRLLILF